MRGLSPSGARAVFEVRGEIVTVPARKGSPRLVSRSPGAHDRSPAWSPDGRRIAWFSDASDEYRLRIAAQDGSGEVRTSPSPAPASTRISPGARTVASWPIPTTPTVSTGSTSTAVRMHRVGGDQLYGPVNGMSFSWSPDSRWIAYNSNNQHLHQPGLDPLAGRRSLPPGHRRPERQRRAGVGCRRRLPLPAGLDRCRPGATMVRTVERRHDHDPVDLPGRPASG